MDKELLALAGVDPSPERRVPDIKIRGPNNDSRQDVKAALRQIAKSIERHTRTSGMRGYLAFLREFFRP